MNKHQKYLGELANKLNWNFDGNKSVQIKDYSNFTMSNIGKLILVQNQIHGVENETNFKFAEVEIDMDIRTIAADTLIPALLLTPTKSNEHIPVFTLEKEGFFDKVKELSGFDDIDFDNHPEFSKKFLLKGNHEDNVRSLFKEELIKLIESNPHYHIESNGSAIVIYRFDHNNAVDKVEQIISFGRELNRIIK